MEDTRSSESGRPIRGSAASSRRVLMAAGAGWVLAAAGLYLPESMDEAEARDSGLGGRHGQDHRGRDKHHDHHEHRKNRQRAKKKRGIRDVQVTLINGTSQLLSFGLWPVEPDRHLGPQERETFNQGSSTGATLFVRNTTTYTLDAGNPALGLPHVWIYDEDSNTVVFDERLTEGQQVDSQVFLVKRLTDTADDKVFEVTAHD